MNEVGLVLAGGGGKGAYHIGVWKALREYGVERNITAVSGTSVGALNSVLFIQGDLGLAEEVWLSISQEKILSIDPIKLVGMGAVLGLTGELMDSFKNWAFKLSNRGVFSRKGLLELLDDFVDLEFVAKSRMISYATCCERFTLAVKYFHLNQISQQKMKSILLATSAFPGIFDSVEIDGKAYIDGGLRDNMPIKPLYSRGYRNFIVVHLGRGDIIEKERFPGANIIEILPYEDQGGLFKGTLDFTPEGAKRRIEQGYQDTIRILKPIYEMGLVQVKVSQTFQRLQEQERDFSIKRHALFEERKRLKDELHSLLNNNSKEML